jgi:hypothetical protein
MAERTNTPQEQLARQAKSLKKGDKYWCMLPRLKEPKKGKIISLSTSLSKQIGLEFDEDVGGHSCDGCGKQGYCLYCRISHLANDDMIKAIEEQRKADLERIKGVEGESLEEIDLTADLK